MYIYLYDSDGIYIAKSYAEDGEFTEGGDGFLLTAPEYEGGFGDFIVKDGSFYPYVKEKTDEEKLSEFLHSVSNALSICNSVGLQCYMTSTAFPIDWVTYREKLVTLSTTTAWSDSLNLTTQPSVPTGITI
jgi:hypothetical protein